MKILKNIKKTIKSKKNDWYFVALLVICLLILSSVVRYALRTYQYPIWDEQHYMQMASEFYRMVKHSSLSTPADMLQLLPFRQPGFPLAILPFLLLFGLSNSYFWAILVNGIFYVITIVGIYFLAKHFLSNKTSFLAAVIFASYGWTLMHLHTAYSETSTSAMIVLAFLFLMKSNLFRNKKYALVFGACLGFAILIRWVAIIFVLGPALVVIYQIIKKRLYKNKQLIKNCLFSLLITAIILFPYYVNAPSVLEYFGGHQVGGEMWKVISEQERNPFSLFSLTFYLSSFAKLGIVYFIFFLVGLIIAFRNKNKFLVLLSAIIIPWIFFSFFSILKSDRFIVPIYPYIAIISVIVFDYIKNSWRKSLFVVLLLIFSSLVFIGSTWGKGPMSENLATLPLNLPFGQLDKIYLTSISIPPNIYRISGKEIISFVAEESEKDNIQNPRVTWLFSFRPLDEPMYTYNLYNLEEPLQIISLVGSQLHDLENDPPQMAKYSLVNTDYVLVKTGKRIDYLLTNNNYEVLEAMILLTDKHIPLSEYFEKKAEFWVYQDSSIVTVYKKSKNIKDERLEEVKNSLTHDLEEMKNNKQGAFAED